jgi:hypothetical protein
MRIKAAIALLASLALVGAGGCTSCKGKPSPTHLSGRTGILVKIVPSKPEYARGEQIVLSVELTSTEANACLVSQVPAGSLTFVSLTRDGNVVSPVLSIGNYIDGFTSYLNANVTSLAPGGAFTMLVKSDESEATGQRQELETSSLNSLDNAELAFWPVDEPGRYTLAVRYALPHLPNASSEVCRASGEPVQTQFTVVAGRT